jgi:hypothetical protein
MTFPVDILRLQHYLILSLYKLQYTQWFLMIYIVIHIGFKIIENNHCSIQILELHAIKTFYI